MATSGATTINLSSNGDLQLTLSWDVASQSVANNSSSVNWYIKLYSRYNINTSTAKSLSVSINGSSVFNGTVTVGSMNGTTKTLRSGTTTIAHNADGTKTFSYSATFNLAITYSGVSIGSKTLSGSGTLNTIPRHATITSVGGTITDNNFSPSVAFDRKGASTVNLKIECVGTAWTQTADPFKNYGAISGTTYSPTLTSGEIDTLRTRLINGQTATLRFTIFSTVGGTTSYSYIDKTFTIVSKPPTINSVAVSNSDTAISNKFGANYLIKNYTKPKVVITATGQYGATIKTYETIIEGKTYTGQTITATEFLMLASTNSISVKITDGRGFSTTQNISITVNDYTLPNATLSAFRCDENGNEKEDGDRVKFIYTGNITPLGNNNNKSFILQHRQQGQSSWTNAPNINPSGYSLNGNMILLNFSPDNAYEAQIVVADYFNNFTTLTTHILTSFSLIDFHKDGKGIAFGKASALNGFEIGAKMPLHNYADTPNQANIPYCTYKKRDGTIGAIISTGANGDGLNIRPYNNGVAGGIIQLLPNGTINLPTGANYQVNGVNILTDDASRVVSFNNAGAITINGTGVDVASITIGIGTWIVIATCEITANGTSGNGVASLRRAGTEVARSAQNMTGLPTGQNINTHSTFALETVASGTVAMTYNVRSSGSSPSATFRRLTAYRVY